MATACRLFTFAMLGATVVACGDPTFSTPTIPTALLTAFVRSAGGKHVLRPEAVFALAGTAPSADSRSTIDTCQAGPFAPQGGGFPEQLEAGDSVLFVLGNDTTILRPANQLGIDTYVADPPDIDYVPGATLLFSIPGAAGGFPGARVSSVVVPILTSLTPIPAQPPADQPLTLTWEPAGDDSSRFEIQFLYATPGGQNYDQRLICDWRDDGGGTIRPELLSGWITSEVHRIEVTRYRTRLQQLGDTAFFLLTTFDTAPPVVQ